MKVVSRREKGEKYEHKRLFCASVDDRNSGTLFLHRVITEWPLDGQTFCLIRGNIGVLACLQSCGQSFSYVESGESSRESRTRESLLLREQLSRKTREPWRFYFSRRDWLLYRWLLYRYYFDSTVRYSITIKLIKNQKKKKKDFVSQLCQYSK